MRRRLFVSLLCLSCLTTAALARYGSVRTKDGRIYEGDVREGQQSVQIARGTIQTTVARGDVASITYTGETLDALQARHKELKPDDQEARLRIAREAFRGGYYDFARQVANEALDKDPNSKEAVELLESIRRQLVIEARRAAADTNAPATTPFGEPAPVAPPKAYLTDEEINLLKQSELKPEDAERVRVRFRNDVQRRYAALPQANPRFLTGDVFDQALLIIGTGDVALRKDVLLTGDPGSIREFRQSVQRILINGCATSSCHGTFAGGEFFLYSTADTEPAAYTNFYMLAVYQKKGPGADKAIFGGASSLRKMIDRLNPSRSLMLQYGLPIQNSISPHPSVREFRPVFASENDPQFRRVQDWLTASLSAQEPIYPISYVAPKPPAATLPATTQSVRPPVTQPGITPPRSAAPNPLPVPSVQPAPPPPPVMPR